MSGVELKSYLNIINGKNVPSQTGQSLNMIDPCSGKTFATIPDSNDADMMILPFFCSTTEQCCSNRG